MRGQPRYDTITHTIRCSGLEGLGVEAISTFDIFKIGVGPSSSHTMGPWRAAQRFLGRCRELGHFDRIERVQVDLYGSLAKTGRGHGTDLAVLLGLSGEDPVTCDPGQLHAQVEAIRAAERICLDGNKTIPFRAADLVLNPHITLPFHPNGLTFTAFLHDASTHVETYYSVGGGFVVQEKESADGHRAVRLPLPVDTAADVLRHCHDHHLTIAQVVRRNESTWYTAEEVRARLAQLWSAMRACIFRGCHTDGILPGALGVVRRAARIHRTLLGQWRWTQPEEWVAAIRQRGGDFQETVKWVSCFALAVNEENAAFGRVVTAPTNGAAGVVPAVLLYHDCFCRPHGASVEDFLLTAAMIGTLFKKGATISAALGGCQAEIGVSSAMAAAGLAQCLDGTPEQVLMAAEIAMEHHLGLTCDPVGGLVQVPCIERNTMGAVKAITACQLALASDPAHAKVPLDAVIRSMWATAQDMSTKYKETSEGGLALQIPVSVSEC
jgi:L-serine dehydratase